MGKRITVVVDKEIFKQLKRIQAKKITELETHVSFSSVVNLQLKKSLK